jgi:hypothetical protein
MPRIDHRLIDAIQDFGGEQLQAAPERLQFVLRLVRPIAVAEHLAQCAVLVGQLLDAVEVGVQPQTQHAQHEDALLLHAGSTRVGIGLALALDTLRQDFAQDRKDALAQAWLRVDVL